MVERYFYAHAGTDHGPYSALQMRVLADTGQIAGSDFIWKQGTTHRVLASDVPNLHRPSAAAAPVEAASAPVIVPPAPAIPAAVAPAPRPKEREKRVVEIRGGILCSQDGVSVRFKKKCTHCGQEEPARSTAQIRNGSMRVPFYCRKCKKPRTVEMRGIC
jgi:hypothetical protein